MTPPGAQGAKRLTGAVLCGGRGSRMHVAVPKHAIKLGDGRAMIEHVIDALSGAECIRQVILVGSSNEDHALSTSGLPVIADLRSGLGPLGGVEALLASGVDDEYIICPCDVPRITPEVFGALIESGGEMSTVLRLRSRSEPNPLPARISSDALPIVREMLDAGRRAVHRLHEQLSARVIDAPVEWEKLLANVNTPEDLAELNRR